jgi:PPP family 3-phenylpropionic acid transporter
LVPTTQSKSHVSRATDLTGVRLLVSTSRFPVLLAVAALVYGSHAMHDAFSVIRWSDAGIGTSAISILWSEAVASEVVVFFLVGPALVGRFGARGAATLAATAGLLRWSVAGVTTSVPLLAILQPLHGLTFALLHLACMRMMADLVPVNLSATAQGLYAFASGFMTTGLTLLSGTLYAWYGGASFFVMAVLCGVAVPIAWFGLTDNNDHALNT